MLLECSHAPRRGYRVEIDPLLPSFDFLWLLLPHDITKKFKGLCITPFGWSIVPQPNRQPAPLVVMICDFSFHGQNGDTLPIAPLEAMQFGQVLEHFLHLIVMADPCFGPPHMIKVNISSDGFYRVWIRVLKTHPKAWQLGSLAWPSPTSVTDPWSHSLPLSSPGLENPPSPIFSCAMEMIADLLANTNDICAPLFTLATNPNLICRRIHGLV